jgi:DNA-directed RNA polymerase I subunit RPA43
MLSLVGSIQLDPFSPQHVPQTKPDRAQSPQSPSPPYLARDLDESGAGDDEDLDAPARLSPADDGAPRRAKGEKETPEKRKKKREKEEKKRKRKGDNTIAKSGPKSEPKPKRKKAS